MPKKKSQIKLIKTNIFNPLSMNEFQYIESGGILIEGDKISKFGKFDEISKKYENLKVINRLDYYALPGLIDSHIHLPQFEAKSCGTGELLNWLAEYIFPLELKFKDDNFAKEKSEQFFHELLKHGTTTAVIYSANFMNATDIAFSKAKKSGIRAFIGNSLMDANGKNELYHTKNENIEIVNKLLKKWHGIENRLFYILSPRFAGSVSPELMEFCSELSNKSNILVQTHLSENLSEIEYISKLFPNSNYYTDIYKDHGLISDKTLLAHCIHLNNHELEIIKQFSSKIVHCPSSNRFLGSGIMPLSKYIDQGIDISLGTDVAAGYSASILNEAKEALEMSKLKKFYEPSMHFADVTIENVFYLATLAGAKVLNIDNITGNLAVGKYADLIFINKNRIPERKSFNEPNNILSEIIYNIREVDETYVMGHKVYS